jgi:hypothetical protein
MTGPKNREGNLAAIRKAFTDEEMKRDAAFDEQIKRLLAHLDNFEREAVDDGRPS